MALNRRGIPAKVLNGKVPKYITVHNTYKAYLLKEIMRLLHESFWARAKGGTDDLGNKWKPLAPSTEQSKPLTPIEKRTFKVGNNLKRGLLTPTQNRIWSRVYARALARLERKGETEPEKKAASIAWNVVKGMGARTIKGLPRDTQINIRTGRLLAATYPGSVANNRYYPPKDQGVEVRPRSVRITFKRIPYAKEVDKVRPIVPDDISKWREEAHEVAILKALPIYERIKNEHGSKRRRKPPKR